MFAKPRVDWVIFKSSDYLYLSGHPARKNMGNVISKKSKYKLISKTYKPVSNDKQTLHWIKQMFQIKRVYANTETKVHTVNVH